MKIQRREEQIPITPSVLVWARERMGYSIEEIASSFKNIEAWEAGEFYPSYKQLEKIAEKYKCPVAVFFFPEPPKLEPIKKSFRTLPDAEYELIPHRIRFFLHKAKAMQINLAELNEGINPTTKHIIHDLNFNAKITIDQAVNQVRSYLDIDLEKQISWKSPDEAFEKWRDILYANGVYIFKDAFKNNDFSGFCLYDETFPIIFVNNSTAKNRQIFTIFHELAHILFRTSGIDKQVDDYIDSIDDSSAKRVEYFCNQFSADFLVPNHDFRKIIEKIKINEENILSLSERYKVSREVILRKFLDMELIDQAFYEQKTDEWRTNTKPRNPGGNYYKTQIIYLGKNYVNLALSKYHQNKISISKLSDYLNIKVKNIGKFEDNFMGRSI